MMKHAELLWLVACGCAVDTMQTGSQSTGSDGSSTSDDPAPGAAVEWRAVVTTTNAGYAISGDAIVRVDGDERGFRARITIRNDDWGTERAWYVRAGLCATGGPIIGDGTWYPPLSTDGAGSATTSAAIPVTLDATCDYHVVVQQSASPSSMPIGCGNLRLD